MNDAAHNERVKLTATLLNSTASGLVVTGVVAPLVAALYGVPGPAQAGRVVIAGATAFWLLMAGALHLAARYVLRDLR